MVTEEFDNVSLSDCESDSSYDMGNLPSSCDEFDTKDTHIPLQSASKVLKVDVKGKCKAVDNGLPDELKDVGFDNTYNAVCSKQAYGTDELENADTSILPAVTVGIMKVKAFLNPGSVERHDAQTTQWSHEAQMTSGNSDAESMASNNFGLDAPGKDRNDVMNSVADEEEYFHDLQADLNLVSVSAEFLQKVEAITDLLHGITTEDDETTNRKVSASLQEHSRAIAAMFGDDIPVMVEKLATLARDYSALSHTKNQQWVEREAYRAQRNQSMEARRQLETLHQQTIRKSKATLEQFEKDKNKMQSSNADLRKIGNKLMEEISLLEGKLNQTKETFQREENQYLTSITAAQTAKFAALAKLSKMVIERDAERDAKHNVMRRLEEAKTQDRGELKNLTRKNNTVLADNDTLTRVWKSVCEELNTTKTKLGQANEAGEAAQRAMDILIAEKLRLEFENKKLSEASTEVKAEFSRIAENERRGRNVLMNAAEHLQNKVNSLQMQYGERNDEAERLRDAAQTQNAVLNQELTNSTSRSIILDEELKATRKELASLQRQAKDGLQRKDALQKEKLATENELRDLYKKLHTLETGKRFANQQHLEFARKNAAIIKKFEKQIDDLNSELKPQRRFVKVLNTRDTRNRETIARLRDRLSRQEHLSAEIEKFKNSMEKEGAQARFIARLVDQRQAHLRKIQTLMGQVDENKEHERTVKILQGQLRDFQQTSARMVDQNATFATRIVILKEDAEATSNFQEAIRADFASFFHNIKEKEDWPFDDCLRELDPSGELGDEFQNQLARICIPSAKLYKSLKTIVPHNTSKPDDFVTTSDSTSEDARLQSAKTIAQQLLDHEEQISRLEDKIWTQELSRASQLKTLARFEEQNKALIVAHDAIHTELIERRHQIADFEATQLHLELSRAEAMAQMQRFKTKTRCLQDMHDADQEALLKAEADLRKLQQRWNAGAKIIEDMKQVLVIADEDAKALKKKIEEAEKRAEDAVLVAAQRTKLPAPDIAERIIRPHEPMVQESSGISLSSLLN